ncbi:phage tail tip lysozyme [Pseudomonas juntendi]|uniref:Phage tail lysozyme domain-containing protein n=1 Tax=Pseudomonas juntendi TaxID=2666183 RepID=A0A7W2LZ08_9PSED|nr:phage tail tip lysozyme [Pseudomonas juntendi]MBA6134660.1 hypothetical protein [Pseudomonas juntendi]MBA6149671.1 hypothetical protein [Pseudomonas juntendi]
MKVLESFLIALGLKVDEKSFQQGQNAFTGLTNSALKLGAVLASKLAIDKVVGDFKNAGTQLDNFNRLTGHSTQRVQALGQAFAAMGGDASDAFDTYQKIQDLMNSRFTGNIQWAADAAKYGFDPDLVINPNKAADATEALANTAEGLEKLPPLQRRLAAQAMGFTDQQILVLTKGRKEIEKISDPLGKLGIMTGKQVEDAARLTSAMNDVDAVFADIGNTIAGELTPAFTEMAEDFVEFYRANKDLVDSGLKEFFGGLAKNIELVAVAMALMGGTAALKGMLALRTLIGLGGAAAGAAGAGAGAAGAAGGIAARSLLFNPVTVGLAALTYSSNLNEGEDEELRANRLRKGGSEAALAVVDYFRSKGWTEEQAKGIAANLEQESGFRADAVGDGGKAYGLAQWHPDRQADFAAYLGKDIRKSTAQEQLDFIHYELTQGKWKSAGNLLKLSSSARESAGIVSKYYEIPKDEAGEIARRGDIADSYGSSSPASNASAAPELTQAQVDKMLGRASYTEHTKALQEQLSGWAKSQRRAPEAYTASDVVAPTAAPQAAPSSSQEGEWRPVQRNDNRQYHIHGADIGKVKQLLNEEMSTLINHTSENFKSAEK